jgi:hypothetical protein
MVTDMDKASIHGQMVTNTMGNGRMEVNMEKESGCSQVVVREKELSRTT